MRILSTEQMKLYDFERGFCSLVTYYKVFGFTIHKRVFKWSIKNAG